MNFVALTILMAAVLCVVVLLISSRTHRRDPAVRAANRNAIRRARDISEHKHRDVPA
jgi:hypothetical protein